MATKQDVIPAEPLQPTFELTAAGRPHREDAKALNAAGTRAGLERTLGRLKDLYLAGDIDKRAYQLQKAEITAELATSPAEGAETDHAARERVATFLAQVLYAWVIAAPEERNRRAGQLFTWVVAKNRTAVAVAPRPELRSFFVTVAVNPDGKVCTGGSDGGRLSTFNTHSTVQFASRYRIFGPLRRSPHHGLPPRKTVPFPVGISIASAS